MINQKDFFKKYSQFSELSIGMIDALMAAKRKNPDLKIESSMLKIETLGELQIAFANMYWDCFHVDIAIQKKLSEQQNKIKKLETELESYKDHIRL